MLLGLKHHQMKMIMINYHLFTWLCAAMVGLYFILTVYWSLRTYVVLRLKCAVICLVSL